MGMLMGKTLNVFLSYSDQDHRFAEKLGGELRAHGISTSSMDVVSYRSDEDWQQRVKRAVTSADAVVVLVDSKHAPDPHQQFEWSAALEATWADPSKRLIPLLLRNAEPPSFLADKQACRVKNPSKEWKQAGEALIHALKDTPAESEQTLPAQEEASSKRQARLQYIEEAAHNLKMDEG